jgi:hypothetical protein
MTQERKSLLLINWVSVTDYTLPSETIIDNILEFQAGEEIIGAHMLLLVELQNIIEDNNNNNSTLQ